MGQRAWGQAAEQSRVEYILSVVVLLILDA